MATRPPDPQNRRVAHLGSLAYVLDNSIPIPGTGMRVGLDAVIGLIPGFGDVAGGALSAYIVVQAARLGTPVPVLLRMLMNLLVEVFVGAVPVLGDLFDAGFKANVRNLKLLENSLGDAKGARRSSLAVVLGVLIAVLLLLAATVYLAVMVISGIGRLARGEAVTY
jgi:hypothetical protein